MKNASPGLIALLNSGTQFFMADLYTFMLTGGVIQRYTNADVDITYNGNLFSKFIISRSKTKVSVGLEVDILDIRINPSPADMLAGFPWVSSVRNGRLDGAVVRLEKVFMPTWGDTSLGAVQLFQGRVAPADFSRTEVKLQAKSELELLDTQLPRNFFQSPCKNKLFDGACTLTKSSFAVNGSVSSGTQAKIWDTLGKPADWFTLGTIQFFSGPNLGVIRSIKLDSGDGNLYFSTPLPFAPGVGDLFTAYPGCDKTMATCKNKFNNLQNFIGYAFVPDPEVAI